ncbi:hypothetical protein GCM10023094_15940 [Rhodococcus olei]|uniref:Uncharacterized protein n=1 Tax=Rhodococcus olei TaxID=2161675 RepID=A0ABP8NZU5_9NOCA
MQEYEARYGRYHADDHLAFRRGDAVGPGFGYRLLPSATPPPRPPRIDSGRSVLPRTGSGVNVEFTAETGAMQRITMHYPDPTPVARSTGTRPKFGTMPLHLKVLDWP